MGQAQQGANQAFAQAQSARFEQWKNRRQFEHGEFLNRMQNQIKNRQTSQINARRWVQNTKIAEAANKNRAEEEFWIRWNFDNDTNTLSKKHQQVNDSLLKSLDKRNINMKSGTARHMLRASLMNAQEQLSDRAVSNRNQMKSAERKQMAALAKRDFGYNSHTTLIPGLYIDAPTIDPMAAYSSAYSSGMGSALLSGISGGVQGAFMGSQMGDAAAANSPNIPAGYAGTTYAGPPAP